MSRIIDWISAHPGLFVGLLLGLATLCSLPYAYRVYQHSRVSAHAEATIARHTTAVAADQRARCQADIAAAFLAGRRYEAHLLDSLSHAQPSRLSVPALPAHPPRQ